MLTDTRTTFCTAKPIAMAINTNGVLGVNGGTGSADIIDRGATPTLVNMGSGQPPLYLVIVVTTTFVGASSSTQFELRSDTTTLWSSTTTHINTGPIAVSLLVAGTSTPAAPGGTPGYTLAYPLPSSRTYERYLVMWQTVTGASVTAGAVSVFITAQPPDNAKYPNAI